MWILKSAQEHLSKELRENVWQQLTSYDFSSCTDELSHLDRSLVSSFFDRVVGAYTRYVLVETTFIIRSIREVNSLEELYAQRQARAAQQLQVFLRKEQLYQETIEHGYAAATLIESLVAADPAGALLVVTGCGAIVDVLHPKPAGEDNLLDTNAAEMLIMASQALGGENSEFQLVEAIPLNKVLKHSHEEQQQTAAATLEQSASENSTAEAGDMAATAATPEEIITKIEGTGEQQSTLEQDATSATNLASQSSTQSAERTPSAESTVTVDAAAPESVYTGRALVVEAKAPEMEATGTELTGQHFSKYRERHSERDAGSVADSSYNEPQYTEHSSNTAVGAGTANRDANSRSGFAPRGAERGAERGYGRNNRRKKQQQRFFGNKKDNVAKLAEAEHLSPNVKSWLSNYTQNLRNSLFANIANKVPAPEDITLFMPIEKDKEKLTEQHFYDGQTVALPSKEQMQEAYAYLGEDFCAQLLWDRKQQVICINGEIFSASDCRVVTKEQLHVYQSYYHHNSLLMRGDSILSELYKRRYGEFSFMVRLALFLQQWYDDCDVIFFNDGHPPVSKHLLMIQAGYMLKHFNLKCGDRLLMGSLGIELTLVMALLGGIHLIGVDVSSKFRQYTFTETATEQRFKQALNFVGHRVAFCLSSRSMYIPRDLYHNEAEVTNFVHRHHRRIVQHADKFFDHMLSANPFKGDRNGDMVAMRFLERDVRFSRKIRYEFSGMIFQMAQQSLVQELLQQGVKIASFDTGRLGLWRDNGRLPVALKEWLYKARPETVLLLTTQKGLHDDVNQLIADVLPTDVGITYVQGLRIPESHMPVAYRRCQPESEEWFTPVKGVTCKAQHQRMLLSYPLLFAEQAPVEAQLKVNPQGQFKYVAALEDFVLLHGQDFKLDELEAQVKPLLPLGLTAQLVPIDAGEISGMSTDDVVLLYSWDVLGSIFDCEQKGEMVRELLQKIPEPWRPHFVLETERLPLTAEHKADRNAARNVVLSNSNKLWAPIGNEAAEQECAHA